MLSKQHSFFIQYTYDHNCHKYNTKVYPYKRSQTELILNTLTCIITSVLINILKGNICEEYGGQICQLITDYASLLV